MSRIKKFPLAVIENSSFESSNIILTSKLDNDELENQFYTDQFFDLRDALEYVEKNVLSQNICSFTAHDLVAHIKEIHRIAAHSLLLLTENGISSGRYAAKPVQVTKETGKLNYEYENNREFSQHNYAVLETIYGKNIANEYKRFCYALSAKLKKYKNPYVPEIITDNRLDKHKGYPIYCGVINFGEKPERIAKAMLAYCQALLKLFASNINPFECAARTLLGFCKIHPFANGNGRVSRILTNCVLMNFGKNPIHLSPLKKKLFYKVYEASAGNNIKPLVSYIKKVSLEQKNSRKKYIFSKSNISKYLEWDTQNFCVKNQGSYAIIPLSKYKEYLKLLRADTSLTHKKLDNLIKLRINGDFCLGKAKKYELLGYTSVAIYYYIRSGDFYLQTNDAIKAEMSYKKAYKLGAEKVVHNTLFK